MWAVHGGSELHVGPAEVKWPLLYNARERTKETNSDTLSSLLALVFYDPRSLGLFLCTQEMPFLQGLKYMYFRYSCFKPPEDNKTLTFIYIL